MKSKKLIRYLIGTYEKAINDLQSELAELKSEVREMKEGLSNLNTGMDEAYDALNQDRKLIRFIFDGDEKIIEEILNNKRKNWTESQKEKLNPEFTEPFDFTREDDLIPPTFPSDEIVDVSPPPVFDPMADDGEGKGGTTNSLTNAEKEWVIFDDYCDERQLDKNSPKNFVAYLDHLKHLRSE